MVPEFAVEHLPLGRTAALVPEFAVKVLPLGGTVMMVMYNYILVAGFFDDIFFTPTVARK